MSSIIAEFIPTLLDILAVNNDIISIIKGVFNLTYFTYVFAIGITFFYNNKWIKCIYVLLKLIFSY
jgi:hypothetical protein